MCLVFLVWYKFKLVFFNKVCFVYICLVLVVVILILIVMWLVFKDVLWGIFSLFIVLCSLLVNVIVFFVEVFGSIVVNFLLL